MSWYGRKGAVIVSACGRFEPAERMTIEGDRQRDYAIPVFGQNDQPMVAETPKSLCF